MGCNGVSILASLLSSCGLDNSNLSKCIKYATSIYFYQKVCSAKTMALDSAMSFDSSWIQFVAAFYSPFLTHPDVPFRERHPNFLPWPSPGDSSRGLGEVLLVSCERSCCAIE